MDIAEEWKQEIEDKYGVEQWLGADPISATVEAIIKVPGGQGSDTPETACKADVWFRTDQSTGKIIFDKMLPVVTD